MTESAQKSIDSAKKQVEELSKPCTDQVQKKLIGGILLDALAAFLHQWHASACIKAGRWEGK